MLERVWRKGNPLTLLVGMQTSTATMDDSLRPALSLGGQATAWVNGVCAKRRHIKGLGWLFVRTAKAETGERESEQALISLYGNTAAQTSRGTISCQSEWLRSKSLQAINAGEGVEKREPSYTVGRNAN